MEKLFAPMKMLLAVLLCLSLAYADDAPTVKRTVVFRTTPAGAAIVQLLPERGPTGTADVEMEILVPIKGNNVSPEPLHFEANLPGHKPLTFQMDTKGPDYNMDVNAVITYTVVERLQPDGSMAGGVDYIRSHPMLIGAAVVTMLAGIGAGVYASQSKKTQSAAADAEVAARPAPSSYLDHQLPPPDYVTAPKSEDD